MQVNQKAIKIETITGNSKEAINLKRKNRIAMQLHSLSMDHQAFL
jgi:hypothetical protein